MKMDALTIKAGVVHALPFHLYDDENRRPTRCELMVHPDQAWAIATEITGLHQPTDNKTLPGLNDCCLTLASRVCQQYLIEPDALILFTRYVYANSYESLYAIRFAQGERDLFESVRFIAARRELVSPEQLDELTEQLLSGQAPADKWRSLAVASKPAK